MGKWRADIIDFDEERKVVEFDLGTPKKITGSRIAAIVGMNEYTTPFKVACEIAKLWKEEPTKYTEAGHVIEPVIRDYTRRNLGEYIGDGLGAGTLGVEDPVDPQDCHYEHFPGREPFGGMVDGYVLKNGKRAAILEIKTANKRDAWFDENGDPTVPSNYILQASLYAELAGLTKILFVVGFPEPEDYDHPETWRPTPENTLARFVDSYPMKELMIEARTWYDKYIRHGVTPPWTDADKELVDHLLANSVNY